MRLLIAISGLHGTGKSTFAQYLATQFGLNYISAGKTFREMARRKSYSIIEYSKLASNDVRIDFEIDNIMREKAEKSNAILEGQLAAWMIVEEANMKILLTAPVDVRIQRIAKRDGLSLDEARKRTLEREDSEKNRYLKYYGINLNDVSIYDLIFDTSLLNEERTMKILKDMVIDFLIKDH